MLEDYFAKPSTIDRIRAHWLAPQIERYVEWMQTNGYADRTIRSRVPYLCYFADFTARRGVIDLNSAVGQVKEFASDWVASYQASSGSKPPRPKHLHVAQNLKRRGGSAIDSRTTQHTGYAISQKKRKRIEECFGWLKTIALLRKVRHRGTLKLDWIFTFACAAYNLVRMRNLMAVTVRAQ